MGFQLFLDPEGAQEIINDLYICAEESEKSAKSKNEDEPKWVEVVVDSLISLMSQNKHVLRQVVNTVMALLCPHITVSALQAVIEVMILNRTKKKKNSPMKIKKIRITKISAIRKTKLMKPPIMMMTMTTILVRMKTKKPISTKILKKK